MRYLTALVAVLGLLESAVATAWIGSTTPTPTVKRADNDPASAGFVTVQDGQFMRNGKPFFYFGTNAYWLAHLSDENLNTTMKSIADRNNTVVRTWAFNDVTEIPTSGAWFQLLQPNGTAVINTGASGFGRLDAVLNAAEANGLVVQFTLTNNWNPAPNVTAPLRKRANGTELPRGTLSNDYGGMDAYVRAHNLTTHDQFYTNQTLIDAFQNYLNELVPRFANRTSLLAWELANDPRCNSTVADSGQCLSDDITRWHATISAHIKTLDPNHTLTSGTSGFQCMSQNTTQCHKLFPLPTPTPAAPQHSPLAGQKRHMVFSERGILNERKARYKRNAEALQHRAATAADKRKRGSDKIRWSYRGRSVEESHLFKRQQQNIDSAVDGTQRVDSQDISNIPNISFATAQLFPDQNTYEPLMPGLDAFNNTLEAGLMWISMQAAAARAVNKPLALTAFGLVTQNNLPFFVPFNSSQPLFPNTTVNGTVTSTSTASVPTPTLGVGVEQGQTALTDQQQADIYSSWLQTAIDNDVQGIVSYQWGQTGLAPAEQQVTNAPENSQNVFTPNPDLLQQNVSPNDGYQTFSPIVQNVLQLFAIQQSLRNIQLGDAFPDV